MISVVSSVSVQENSSQTSAPFQGQHPPEKQRILVLYACGSRPNVMFYKHRFPSLGCWPCQAALESVVILSEVVSEGLGCRQVACKVGSPIASHCREVKGLHVGDPQQECKGSTCWGARRREALIAILAI